MPVQLNDQDTNCVIINIIDNPPMGIYMSRVCDAVSAHQRFGMTYTLTRMTNNIIDDLL